MLDKSDFGSLQVGLLGYASKPPGAERRCSIFDLPSQTSRQAWRPRRGSAGCRRRNCRSEVSDLCRTAAAVLYRDFFLKNNWSSSNRRQELPPGWAKIRQSVINDAGGVCEIRGPNCKGWATDVDHIKRGSDHSRRNLRAACSVCHQHKSSAEGNAARRKLKSQRKRPTERHPGTLRA